jgi:putative ABC transport system substrate-binding protein
VRRREFITLLGGAAAAASPLAARAQQVPVIGFLRTTEAAGSAHLVDAFRQGLGEAGFVEGRNVVIEYRWAEDRHGRLDELAADLVRRGVAAIVGNSQSVRAAMAATSATPLIFVVGNDPVRTGLVDTLNRPGGNVTGVTFTTLDLVAKQIGLMNELVPTSAPIAILRDPKQPEIETELAAAAEAARAVDRQLVIVKAAAEPELGPAFASVARAGAGALLVRGGATFVSHRRQIAALAVRHGLPASYVTRDFVEVGGLLSYGPSQKDAYRRAGVYAGRILKGAKPADLPVDQPTRFELVINLAVAKALGVEIPTKLLALADEVIE